MKIGIISLIRETWGGSEFLWAKMAEAALQQGHKVVLSRLNTGKEGATIAYLQSIGLEVIYRRGFIHPDTPTVKRVMTKAVHFALEKAVPSLNTFLRTKPDIVLYVGSGLSPKEDSAMLHPILQKGIPLAHNIQLGTEGARLLAANEYTYLRWFYTKIAASFFVSQRNLNALEKQLAMPIPAASVLRNPVNLDDINPVPFPAMHASIKFAMVGNLLVFHKGQDSMFETLALPAWKQESWELNIYGSGPDKAYLQDLAKHYGFEDRVTFHGKVNDIRKLWSENHALLMPSIMEGMPLAVVEAMLCARPVLATDVGGIAEWIDDGSNGFIATCSSSRALHKGLLRMWQLKDNWEKIGLAAHKTAMQMHNPKAGEALLDKLREVIEVQAS